MGGYLYAIELVGVGARMGKTAYPDERVDYHRGVLHAYGIDIVGRLYVSDPMPHYSEAERELHRRLADRRVSVSREVFGIEFDDAIRAIDALADWVPPPVASVAKPSRVYYEPPEGGLTIPRFAAKHGISVHRVRSAIHRAGISTIRATMGHIIAPADFKAILYEVARPTTGTRPRETYWAYGKHRSIDHDSAAV